MTGILIFGEALLDSSRESQKGRSAVDIHWVDKDPTSIIKLKAFNSLTNEPFLTHHELYRERCPTRIENHRVPNWHSDAQLSSCEPVQARIYDASER